MIGIATTTSNATGAMIIREKPESDLNNYPARVSRYATLDGGAVIVHGGYSDGDRTLKVLADMSESDEGTLLNIHQTETLLNISIADGVFSGAIERFFCKGGAVELTILLKEKLSS